MYIFLGSCKDITIGPTAIMGIMTNPFVVQNDSPDFAVLLCFLMGCVIVLVGLLRLGKSTNQIQNNVCSLLGEVKWIMLINIEQIKLCKFIKNPLHYITSCSTAFIIPM